MNLDTLTDQVLDSYAAHGDTQRIGHAFLPSRSAIVEILDLCREMLFPGFSGNKWLTKENVRFHIGNLLNKIGERLIEQITRCLCTERRCSDTETETSSPCRQDAQRLARDFLARVPNIRELLALDAQAAFDGDPAAKSIAEVIYCYPGYYAVTVHRIAHELLTLGVPLMPRIMSEHAHSVTGCDIHPGATIGRSVFIDHATGVVIGETCRIGDNVKIYQGVTLGALSFPRDERGRVIKGLQRHPTIEDNVTIYANATILGGDRVIGRGSVIGGNTFVTESIPADSVVMQGQSKLEVKSRRR